MTEQRLADCKCKYWARDFTRRLVNGHHYNCEHGKQAQPESFVKLDLDRQEAELLQSALYEYIVNRGRTAEEYVNRRYPLSGYSENFRKDKVANVTKNIALAEKLREVLFPK